MPDKKHSAKRLALGKGPDSGSDASRTNNILIVCLVGQSIRMERFHILVFYNEAVLFSIRQVE